MLSRIHIVLALVVLSASLGLAKKYVLTPATIVPAAAGELEIGTDKNGNTELKVRVRHLAKPEGLTPAKSAYVIWIQQTGGTPERAGLLKVNSKLEGSFETTTPYKAFDLSITAEDDPNLKSPLGPEVFRGSVRP
ncbi:MAG: hypothetical protein JO323_09525 [Acidobacteriia bacterium]|nr:hypothetical protein [Terriglobia bacterium]